MPLTAEQMSLIRSSFDAIRDDLEPHSIGFYEELFRRAPALRPMFRDDLGGQGMRFMSTLAVIVDNLHAPEVLAARYQDLGALHARLGVTGEMFIPMGEALVVTIRDVMGDACTTDVEDAWRAAFGEMSAALIDRGAIPDKVG